MANKFKITIDAGFGRKVIDYVEENAPNIPHIVQNMIDAAKCLQYTGYVSHPLKKENDGNS